MQTICGKNFVTLIEVSSKHEYDNTSLGVENVALSVCFLPTAIKIIIRYQARTILRWIAVDGLSNRCFECSEIQLFHLMCMISQWHGEE